MAMFLHGVRQTAPRPSCRNSAPRTMALRISSLSSLFQPQRGGNNPFTASARSGLQGSRNQGKTRRGAVVVAAAAWRATGASAALSTSDNFHVMTLEASAWDSVADDMRAKYESSLQRELGLMGWSKLSSVALQILREATMWVRQTMWIAPPYFRATIYRIGFTILELNNLIQARYAAVRAEREAQRMSFPSQPQWDQLQASLVALSCQQPYPAAQLQQEVTVASVTSVNGITCGFERSNEGDFCVVVNLIDLMFSQHNIGWDVRGELGGLALRYTPLAVTSSAAPAKQQQQQQQSSDMQLQLAGAPRLAAILAPVAPGGTSTTGVSVYQVTTGDGGSVAQLEARMALLESDIARAEAGQRYSVTGRDVAIHLRTLKAEMAELSIRRDAALARQAASVASSSSALVSVSELVTSGGFHSNNILSWSESDEEEEEQGVPAMAAVGVTSHPLGDDGLTTHPLVFGDDDDEEEELMD